MMKRTALAFLLIGLMAAPALAQGRGRGNGGNGGKDGKDRKQQGVPPGHVPPAGLCRVWYDGVPPGRQPSPTECNEAERIASRDRNARVIYGSRTYGNQAPVYRDDRYPDGRYPGDIRPGDDRRYPTTDGRRPNPNPDRRTTGRAVPRTDGRYPTERYRSEAYRQGYEDGVVKGREDVGDRDSFDPARHRWYKSGDRGYNSRYGSRDEYRGEYRRGFLAGYEATHDGRSGRSRWPF